MTDSTETPDVPTGVGAHATLERKKGFSIVWLVPIVAAVIAVWLVVKAISEKGPTITIAFETGKSITAGKTKIRYRDVEIGVVTEMHLTDDLEGVILTVEMVPEAKQYLSQRTRFWVVRARVAAGEVQGLGTLLSGAYIAMDPVPLERWHRPTKSFVGLEKAPAVSSDVPGTSFMLTAARLASVDVGSPVYYHQIEVGRVTNYQLRGDGQIEIEVFIFSPHDAMVTQATRFWNAGGVDITLDANGLKIDTESIVTVMLGGIAFDSPPTLEEAKVAEEGHRFVLYPNRSASVTKTYQRRQQFVTYFSGSLRGLVPGSPVEFRGLRVGQVLDVTLERVPGKVMEFRAPVLIELEPERISGAAPTTDEEETYRTGLKLGLRAQLGSGNVLTGQKVVNVNFFPDAEPVEPRKDDSGRYWIMPSVPAQAQEIFQDLATVTHNLSKVPFDQIGQDLGVAASGMGEILGSDDLKNAVDALSATLEETRTLVATLNADIAPSLAAAIGETEKTAASVRQMLDADTGTQREVTRLIVELTEATRSLRALAEMIEQHPEAFIRGKRK